MNEMIKIFLSLSISGTLLFLLVLGISKLVKDRFSKAWHYYIWLIVILRFLLPFTLEASPVGLLFQALPVSAVVDYQPGVNNQGENIDNQTDANAETANSVGTSSAQKSALIIWNTLLQWLWLVWLGVALLLFIRKITLYQSFTTYIKAGNTEVSDPETLNFFYQICEELGIKRHIELYENPLAASPLILGIFKPAIVLPSTRISNANFRYIVLHELTHYRRGDIYYKWLAQIVLCLHWFNPFVYWLIREVNNACEFACDEAVIKSLDVVEVKAYGDVLIDSISNTGRYKQTFASITLSENAKTVKERLSAIMNYKKKTKTVILTSIALMFALCICGVLVGAASPTTENIQQPYDTSQLPINLEGKSDEYKLIAKMAQIDTSLTVSEYTEKILAICDGNAADFFRTLADAAIIETSDPLYSFATESLACTSSELFADTSGNPNERPFMSAYASWIRYETDEEFEAQRGDMSDAEWNAFLNDTSNDPPNMVAYKGVSYFISYNIIDNDNLTIVARDHILNTVKSDMQRYLEELSEEELFSDNFESAFKAELVRAATQYSNEKMMMECEISLIDSYEPSQY